PFDPFDHLAAELIFDAQPEGRAIDERQRLAIHFKGQERPGFHRGIQVLRLVIGNTEYRRAERIESDCLCTWLRSYKLNPAGKWNAVPLGNPAPTLDAVMHGYARLFPKRAQFLQGELNRILHQTSNLELVISETVGGEPLPIVPLRYPAVRPKMWRNLLPCITL